MTNKNTKRALISSVLALVLCFTMLLGTTFAWFTDSATSKGNTIKTGKLDVQLKLWTSATDSVEITDASDPLFPATTVWEPNMTKVVYLSIANVGSLDLKYKVALDAYGITKNLNEVMQYSITPDAKFGEVTSWTNGLSVTPGMNDVNANDVVLNAGVEHFFALSVHMDETASSDYAEGTIMFDINVLAGQLASELDSFGKDYDADATYPSVAQMNVVDNTVVNTLDTGDNAVLNIPVGAPLGNYEFAVTNKVVTTNAGGETTVSVDFNLTKDGVKVTDDGVTVYTVEVEIGTDMIVTEVTHNGAAIDTYSYDEVTGILSIETTSFSPFTISYLNAVTGLSGAGTEADPYLINNYYELCWFRDHVNTCAADGSSQYNGKYVKLTADIDLKGENWEPIGSTTKDHGSFYGNFDGDGHTIKNLYVELTSGQGAAGFFAKVSGGGDGPRAVVKNLVFENVDVYSPDNYVGGVIGNAGGNSEIRNVTVKGDVYVVGRGYVGGIVGHGYPDMYDCHVDANEGSYLICNYWCGGGIIGYAGEGNGTNPGTIIDGCSVKGLDITSASGGAGAIVGFFNDFNLIKDSYAENVSITSAFYYTGYACGLGRDNTYENVYVKNVTVKNHSGVELNTIPYDGSAGCNWENEALEFVD